MKYLLNVDKDKKDIATKWCKEHDTMLSREIRRYIDIIVTRYNNDKKYKTKNNNIKGDN